MNSDMQCPLCEIGQLSETLFDDHVTHRGKTVAVKELIGFRCNECGEITTSPAQSRLNHSKYLVAKKSISNEKRSARGLLPASEIRRVRELLGLTQVQAAEVFGGGANAFSKYERSEVLPSESMDLLLRLAAEVPAAAAWLLHRACVAEMSGISHLTSCATLQGILAVQGANALGGIFADLPIITGVGTLPRSPTSWLDFGRCADLHMRISEGAARYAVDREWKLGQSNLFNLFDPAKFEVANDEIPAQSDRWQGKKVAAGRSS